MIANLREAKSKLSKLVQLAAQGEEIVITIRGRPMARLTSVVVEDRQNQGREEWAAALSATADAVRVGRSKATLQRFWDELRAERC